MFITQIHVSTNTKHFSLVLSRSRSRPASLDENSVLSLNSYYHNEPRTLRKQSLVRIEAFRAQENTKIAPSRSRCKRDHAKNFRETSTFAPRQLVYPDKPRLVSSSVEDAKNLTTTMYNKRAPKTMESFQIIKSMTVCYPLSRTAYII